LTRHRFSFFHLVLVSAVPILRLSVLGALMGAQLVVHTRVRLGRAGERAVLDAVHHHLLKIVGFFFALGIESDRCAKEHLGNRDWVLAALTTGVWCVTM